MLPTADLDYPLPEELIATAPAEPRDSARLLVVSRTDPSMVQHRNVRDLPEILRPRSIRAAMRHDLLVVNATRVLPARFRGVRIDSGGHVEGLYIQPAPGGTVAGGARGEGSEGGPRWLVLLKMRRMKPGVQVRLLDRHDRDSGVMLRLVERYREEAEGVPSAQFAATEREEPGDSSGVQTGEGKGGGGWIVEVLAPTLNLSAATTAADLLEYVGLTPVPPYILSARRKSHTSVPEDRDRLTYQTVYATGRHERPGHGSVAAPTAGLHFTPGLLERLLDAGVQRSEVNLDVGLGTFKGIETPFVEQHPMHTEWCCVPSETARAIVSLRSQRVQAGSTTSLAGARLIAVGTTAARTLESFENIDDMLRRPARGTNLLITPGYKFRHVDALLTNFHLPRTTLMAMVGAFLEPDPDRPGQGIERLKAIYAEATRERYRFFSFGDAMLILP